MAALSALIYDALCVLKGALTSHRTHTFVFHESILVTGWMHAIYYTYSVTDLTAIQVPCSSDFSRQTRNDRHVQSPAKHPTSQMNFIISPYSTVVWGILSLLCDCFFVRLRISQRRKKMAAWNFARLFDYYPDRSSPNLVNFGSRGVTVAALLPGWAIIEIAVGQQKLGAPVA